MSTPNHKRTPAVALGQGRTKELRAIVEYQLRLAMIYAAMDKQLDAFSEEDDPDWIVLRPARFERWHVDALVIGPPGIFLIWPIWGSAELGLWHSAQLCRRYLADSLGADFTGAVEVVYFRDRGSKCVEGPGTIERVFHVGRPGVCGCDFLRAESTKLDVLLRTWRPPEGLQMLSPEWIDALRPIGYPLGLSINLDGPQPDAQCLPPPPELIDWPPPA